MVFNALDNLDARRHVNKMCIAADVPLIESGTTGFNGQVQPIKARRTQCYDCTPKETPKSFPVCTIRSTPSQPIHCIVWAKSYLFNELFGISEDSSPDLDHTEDSDNKEEIESLRQEAAALKRIRQAMGSEEFARRVFEKVFSEDIKRLRSMEEMWKSRRPPNVLDYDEILAQTSQVPATIADQDQRTWSLPENVAVFNSSLARLSNRLETLKSSSDTSNAPLILSFDKDDKDALDFVASAANLRSIVFGIETRSEFDIKQMAGNIIPAIATTNATTAALCVLEAFKMMQGNLQKAKMVFLAKSLDRTIDREDLRPPHADCPVCGNAQAKLVANVDKVTLDQLVSDVLKDKLGYTEEISISTDAGVIYDPDLDENLSKVLSELGVVKDSFITVIDQEDENAKVNLILSVSEQDVQDEDQPIKLVPENLSIPIKAKPAGGQATSDGELAAQSVVAGGKRKRDADEAELDTDNVRKRGKVPEMSNGNGLITVDDTDGAIVLD